MQIELYTSAFCGPCHTARSVLSRAGELVPAARSSEFDVVAHEERAAAEGIRVTPTTIVRTDDGTEVFRAEGAPTLPRLLAALALAA